MLCNLYILKRKIYLLLYNVPIHGWLARFVRLLFHSPLVIYTIAIVLSFWHPSTISFLNE